MYAKIRAAFPPTLALAALVATGATAAPAAQTDTSHDAHHPAVAQAAPSPQADAEAPQEEQPARPGMMGQGGSGMMGGGMMPDMMGAMQPGMMGAMPMRPVRPHMMKIMFAVADANGDGGLSFEEVSAIHKRIFDSIDANKDGNVTPDEIRQFIQE